MSGEAIKNNILNILEREDKTPEDLGYSSEEELINAVQKSREVFSNSPKENVKVDISKKKRKSEVIVTAEYNNHFSDDTVTVNVSKEISDGIDFNITQHISSKRREKCEELNITPELIDLQIRLQGGKIKSRDTNGYASETSIQQDNTNRETIIVTVRQGITQEDMTQIFTEGTAYISSVEGKYDVDSTQIQKSDGKVRVSVPRNQTE